MAPGASFDSSSDGGLQAPLDTHSCRLGGAELGTLDTWETGPSGL